MAQTPRRFPDTTPQTVTLHDGDTMTASDWRRLTEPVHGYTVITDSQLGDRRVRLIRHTGTHQWVVTVDTRLNSWAYVIKPDAPTDNDATRQILLDNPIEVHWALTMAVTGTDGRIQPAVPFTRHELDDGTTVFITRHGDAWVVTLWHGYVMDFSFRSRENQYYVAFVQGDYAGDCLKGLRDKLDLVPSNTRRLDIDITTETWAKMWHDIDNAVFSPL